SSSRARTIVGAACWMLAVEFFVVQAIAQSAWPGYSIVDQDISALGITTCGPFVDPTTGQTMNVCSPLHVVMNAGFVLLGLLTIAGAVLTFSAWPRNRRSKFGLALLAAGAVGTILTGLSPANVDSTRHGAGALIYWGFGSVGIMLLGLALWNARRGLAIFSLVCGAIALAAFVLYGAQTYVGLGRGIMERIAGYTPTIWLIVLGGALLPVALRDDRAVFQD
ncbi:MAG TPA: DUF998 domain-containing protein, partial [Thermomicrobiales bacterium]|nr:DUF998 domain-containing protein [Thermomicrobiales bacterium]